MTDVHSRSNIVAGEIQVGLCLVISNAVKGTIGAQYSSQKESWQSGGCGDPIVHLVACLCRPLEEDNLCIRSRHDVPSEVLRNFCDDVGCWFSFGGGFDSMARGLVIYTGYSFLSRTNV